MQKWQTDISYAFWRIASVRNVENAKLIGKKFVHHTLEVL